MASAPRSLLAARARQPPRRCCAPMSVATREGRGVGAGRSRAMALGEGRRHSGQ